MIAHRDKIQIDWLMATLHKGKTVNDFYQCFGFWLLAFQNPAAPGTQPMLFAGRYDKLTAFARPA